MWHWMWTLCDLHPRAIWFSFSVSPACFSLSIADQPFMLSSVFFSYPFSSTVCIASNIPPRGSSIRHAKVKTSYCHLAWLNVYQAPSPYLNIWNPDVTSIERDFEGAFVSSSVCRHYCRLTQIIVLSLVTLKVRGERTHSFRGRGCHLL